VAGVPASPLGKFTSADPSQQTRQAGTPATTRSCSTGRPRHLPLRQQVNVQVRYGLTGMRPVVHDEPKSFGELKFSRHDAGNDQEMTEDALILRFGFADAGNQFLRHDEQMHGRLWLDVVEDDAVLVLVFDPGGDFTVDDFLEDRFGHGKGSRQD
jgi:hypothetical protein